ncbi:hypothetical protein O3P69_003848 [Scylla paramamosain]|uniref:Uncharacterized protein n=1 Tax=Scylla paramamosain TaxID=85552 RepID=A0AAW0UH02_SCYPA
MRKDMSDPHMPQNGVAEYQMFLHSQLMRGSSLVCHYTETEALVIKGPSGRHLAEEGRERRESTGPREVLGSVAPEGFCLLGSEAGERQEDILTTLLSSTLKVSNFLHERWREASPAPWNLDAIINTPETPPTIHAS